MKLSVVFHRELKRTEENKRLIRDRYLNQTQDDNQYVVDAIVAGAWGIIGPSGAMLYTEPESE